MLQHKYSTIDMSNTWFVQLFVVNVQQNHIKQTRSIAGCWCQIQLNNMHTTYQLLVEKILLQSIKS
jgi:hypothetical protein